MRQFWKKCLKTAKNGPFFYKKYETSSLSFKKLMLFTESHYSAKAPQNMRYKEQNKIQENLTFSNLSLFEFFFLKNVSILQFLSIFYDFWLYFEFDAKIKVYKKN